MTPAQRRQWLRVHRAPPHMLLVTTAELTAITTGLEDTQRSRAALLVALRFAEKQVNQAITECQAMANMNDDETVDAMITNQATTLGSALNEIRSQTKLYPKAPDVAGQPGG